LVTSDLAAYEVQAFAEKPDEEKARTFVASGQYYWNAGIFVWRVTAILAEMERLLPILHTELQSLARAWGAPDYEAVLAGAWEQVPQTTIDFGVMERANRVAVVPAEIGWNDVGNWATLSELLGGADKGNTVVGRGHPLLLDVADTYLYTTEGRLVAAIGLDGFVVVDTPDALLICPKDRAQDVRDVVDELKARELSQFV
jgi:mannose-1-phosphate guanylyltransferase